MSADLSIWSVSVFLSYNPVIVPDVSSIVLVVAKESAYPLTNWPLASRGFFSFFCQINSIVEK